MLLQFDNARSGDGVASGACSSGRLRGAMQLNRGFALPAKPCQALRLLPYESYNAPRRRMTEAFVASFACLVSCGSCLPTGKIHIFGQAKHSVIEVRRSQDSSGSTSGSRGTGHRARAASHAVLAAKWSSDLQP